jgi:hypothetical protein
MTETRAMRPSSSFPAALLLAISLLVTACGSKSSAEKDRSSDEDEDAPKKDKSAKPSKKSSGSSSAGAGSAINAPTPAPTVAATGDARPAVTNATPATPVTDPSQQTYADVTNPIPNECKSAAVLMTSAPESVGVDYPWTWTRQALLANQQYKVVEGPPSVPGEVSFEVHQASSKHSGAWVLVARCADGGTCNKLAAMQKAIVKGAAAQPVCGALPMDLSPTTRKKVVLRELGNPQNTLPGKTDVIGQCARLHACTVAMDPKANATTDIGPSCQKGPSSFKTSCASEYPCSAVLSCLK